MCIVRTITLCHHLHFFLYVLPSFNTASKIGRNENNQATLRFERVNRRVSNRRVLFKDSLFFLSHLLPCDLITAELWAVNDVSAASKDITVATLESILCNFLLLIASTSKRLNSRFETKELRDHGWKLRSCKRLIY